MPTLSPLETWNLFRQVTDQDMYDYSPYLRSIARGNILEIGVREGVSTAAFLLGLAESGEPGHLYSVDVNPQCGSLYDSEFWTFIHAHSVTQKSEILHAVPPEISILLIDGDHYYGSAYSDLVTYSELVRPGGLILAHDIEPAEEWLPRIKAERWFPVEECRAAWDDFCALHPDWEAEIRPGMTGLGVMVKGDG